MRKLVLSVLFFFCFTFANVANADYECSTNPNAPGCNPSSDFERAKAIIEGRPSSAVVASVTSSADSAARVSRITELQSKIKARQDDLRSALNADRKGDANDAQVEIDSMKAEQYGLLNEIKKFEAAELAKLPSPCANEESKAVSTCTLGLGPVEEALLRQTMNKASAMMAESGSKKTCEAAKMVQTVAMGANFSHAIMCGNAVKQCKTQCETIGNKLLTQSDEKSQAQAKLAQNSLTKCVALESRAGSSIGAGLENMMAIATSAKCARALTTNTGGAPPTAMDCSNPAMASMPSCICAANPADPVCTASNGGLGDGGFSSVGNGSGAVDGGKDPEMFGFEDDLPLNAPGGAGGAASQASGGGGGGGMNGGGGAGELPPEEMGGAGSGPYNTDIMGGLTGGGGSGGGSSFGRGGSGEGSSGGGLFDSLASKFNLKGFLPSKADFKNRGVASGLGADGITGPNGPSLFEKVSARYLKKQSELLP